jgi:hypothetical protein
MMRYSLPLLVIALLCRSASAENVDQKKGIEAPVDSLQQSSDSSVPCIFAAALQLPRIPGLVIESSRSEPLPSGIVKPIKGVSQRLVYISVHAAAQRATFRFVCGLKTGLPPIVSPLPY